MHTFVRYALNSLCIMLFAGCGVTSPSRHYILTPAEVTGTEQTAPAGPSLGIGPVAFPAYLDRPEIVHRSGHNQLHFAGSDRWAEPLKTNFTRTLAENLSRLLPTDHIALHPWPRSAAIDYRVGVDVVRFDADAAGGVVLAAGWVIERTADGTIVDRRKTGYNEDADGLDYPALVAAQSRALERLSRDIAEAIRREAATARP
jgi:uncharacterized lipoprotein YmbA